VAAGVVAAGEAAAAAGLAGVLAAITVTAVAFAGGRPVHGAGAAVAGAVAGVAGADQAGVAAGKPKHLAIPGSLAKWGGGFLPRSWLNNKKF
jgi:hypothetical protein